MTLFRFRANSNRNRRISAQLTCLGLPIDWPILYDNIGDHLHIVCQPRICGAGRFRAKQRSDAPFKTKNGVSIARVAPDASDADPASFEPSRNGTATPGAPNDR